MRARPAYDVDADVYRLPVPEAPAAAEPPPLRDLTGLISPPDPERQVDDWGRSERVYQMMEPVLNFYYRYWFRVEVEGLEHVPASGGALLASNHSGALPPGRPDDHAGDPQRAPQPAPAVHARRALVQGLPGRRHARQQDRHGRPRIPRTRTACCATRAGSCSSSRRVRRARASSSGSATSCGASVAAASSRPRSGPGVPIVPIAVMGAEEAMPIFAHVPLLQRLTGLIYFPINHAFPHFGLLAGGHVHAREVPASASSSRCASSATAPTPPTTSRSCSRWRTTSARGSRTR